MEDTVCPMLVNGKKCGLALILIEQDLDTETEVYECALGHRKYVLIGEMEKRICSALNNSNPCGLALSATQRDPARPGNRDGNLRMCARPSHLCSDRAASDRGRALTVPPYQNRETIHKQPPIATRSSTKAT